MSQEKSGGLWTVSAYIVWGFLPIYWKSLDHVSSIEILLSRVVWAFFATLLLTLLMKNGAYLKEDFIKLWQTQKDFWLLFFASVLISGNWFIYIWAVNHGYLVQSSLGYYMNPLVSVLLGVFFLKEKLSTVQKIAFLFAVIGVCILTWSYGQIPWIAFLLAISFAVYGLVKKTIRLDALRGLTIETFFILIPAVFYYAWLVFKGNAAFLQIDLKTDILLVFTGVATALPLILFAKGVRNIPLYMVGFLQYIAPTIMLFLGVVIYGEKFERVELVSFTAIWLGLILFSLPGIFKVLKMKKSTPHR